MEKNLKKNEPYKSTYEYYAKYRPNIPKEVIDIITSHFNVGLNDRILDLGCGTGKVTLTMDGKCKEMVCLDSDLKMIELAKKETKNSKPKITWIVCNANDLKRDDKLGTFKIATICRAFHWMNQEKVLNNLNNLIDENGGIAIFSDNGLWSGQQEWQQMIKKITLKYLDSNKKERFKNPEKPWDNILINSTFKFIKTYNVPTVREWDIDSIIGYIFSYSSSAPYLFEDKIDEFKKEVQNTLLSINPQGKFQENSIWSITLASKKDSADF